MNVKFTEILIYFTGKPATCDVHAYVYKELFKKNSTEYIYICIKNSCEKACLILHEIWVKQGSSKWYGMKYFFLHDFSSS